MSHSVCPEHTHQLLKSWLIQVALQGEFTQSFPRRLVGLNLHWVSLHVPLVSNWTPSHKWRPREALQALRIFYKNTQNKNDVSFFCKEEFVNNCGVQRTSVYPSDPYKPCTCSSSWTTCDECNICGRKINNNK